MLAPVVDYPLLYQDIVSLSHTFPGVSAAGLDPVDVTVDNTLCCMREFWTASTYAFEIMLNEALDDVMDKRSILVLVFRVVLNSTSVS